VSPAAGVTRAACGAEALPTRRYLRAARIRRGSAPCPRPSLLPLLACVRWVQGVAEGDVRPPTTEESWDDQR
jgi:hypothetical protein